MPLSYLPYQSDFLKDIHDVKDLLIVAAMESEENALLHGLKYTERAIGRRTKLVVKDLSLKNCRVQVVRSGIGPVNAGVLLTMAAEHFNVDAVLLLGVGGALDPNLDIGDTVVSRQIIQHDSISSLDEGNIFIAPGELTLSVDADKQVDPVMRCDSVLVEWITQTLKQSHSGKVFLGTIVSGNEFAATAERKEKLRSLAADALLVEMEAAGLAQVARRLGIPFVTAKTVADRANPSVTISDDFVACLEAAAAHCSAVMKRLIATFDEH